MQHSAQPNAGATPVASAAKNALSLAGDGRMRLRKGGWDVPFRLPNAAGMGGAGLGAHGRTEPRAEPKAKPAHRDLPCALQAVQDAKDVATAPPGSLRMKGTQRAAMAYSQ